jgi:peptidoglycan hydrolase CwlO-like protein
MATAALIFGILLILFAIGYLIVYLFKKMKNREHVLSKKTFYSSLITGIILLILGASFSDTSTAAQLENCNIKVSELEEANKKLKEESAQLNQQIKTLTAKISDYEKQKASLDKEKQALQKQKDSFNKEKEALTKEIASLKSKNEKLQSEVNSLKNQVASSYQESATSSESDSTSSDVYYKNCSEAKAAGAAPIYQGEPGYGSHLDRDGDGIGCDR